MGVFTSKKKEASLEGEEVNFDHFQVIRAIGRGSFGKVCIVQKKDSKQMFAMKYMNKAQCKTRDALSNVFREIEILASVSHPFLVNLWFSFQDAEDMFMVVELLLGGDLRYHLQQGVVFGDEAVRLYVLEVASALTYLHARNIIHRDIKPDNLLLDEEGHVHLTDFNIAAVVRSGQPATSLSGTKPYMAPEVFECSVDECSGYGPAVDWWSLGVSAYEIRRGKRPFDIHSHTSLADIRRMFHHVPRLQPDVHPGLAQLISGLLVVNPGRRITSLEAVRQIPFLAFISMDEVLGKRTKPAFTPPKDHLNCDPTFELEEMIIESRPLHEKKKRLSKQKSLTNSQPGATDAEGEKYGGMLVFNREVEEAKREKERKEREREERERNWQEELEESMRLSDPTGHGCSFTGSQCNTPVKSKSQGGHKERSGHVASSSPLTCVIVTSDDLEHVTRTAVSPTSVRARIAGSPKVRVKGSTVTIQSPRSSSSSHTKTSTQYLQERLKELQAEQRRATTETQSSDVTHSDDVTINASQSQRSVENRSTNHRTGMKNDQSECQEEKSSANHVEGSNIGVEKREEEEKMVCLHAATTTTTTTTSTTSLCKNNNNNNLSNRSNNKRKEEEEEKEEEKRTREEEKRR